MFLSVIGNVFVIITAVFYGIYQSHIVEIGNQLSEFRFKLFPRNNKKFRNLHYFIIIPSFPIIWIGSFIIPFIRSKMFIFIAACISAIFQSDCLMQYSLIINILKDKFKGLNESFRAMAKKPVESHNISFSSRNMPNNRLHMHNFITTRKARHMLYRIACQVSHFHSFPVLLIIFHSCCNCVSVLYFAIINFIHREENSSSSILPFYRILEDMFWITLYAYPVVMLSETVKRFNSEVWIIYNHFILSLYQNLIFRIFLCKWRKQLI